MSKIDKLESEWLAARKIERAAKADLTKAEENYKNAVREERKAWKAWVLECRKLDNPIITDL